jgi:hypothetical protein
MVDEQEQSLIEKELDTLYKQIFAGEKRGKRVGRIRRIVAYTLKFIAGGGSLAVATGYFAQWTHPIGVAILVAVFLDTISSNHKRLLSEVEAGYAYEFLRMKVSRKFNRQYDPLNKQLKKADLTKDAAESVQSAIDTLQQTAHQELSEGIEEIRKKLASEDVKALQFLALDSERAAAHQQALAQQQTQSGG